jgi:cell division protein FtsA
MAHDPLVALEVGTTRIRALVGELREGMLSVIGLGESESAGIRKSDVVDMDHAVTALRTALEAAEERSNVTIYAVHLAVSGGHVRAEINRGTVHITRKEGEITEKEIDAAREAARSGTVGPDEEPLHTLHQKFYVDGVAVLDPLHMAGNRLEEDALIIRAGVTPVVNLVKVVETAPVDVEDVAFSGLCAGYGVLSPEQKYNGALVIDLGGGTTSYVVYADQTIAYAGAFGVGGDHVTNDIAFALNLPQAQAEKLKRRHGAAVVTQETRKLTATLPPEGGFAGRTVRKVELDVVINARMDELFRMIRRAVEREGRLLRLGAGVVLTGGGARLGGVTELARSVFGLPCTVGEPSGLSGVTSIVRGPEYASAVGLLKYAHQNQRQQSAPGRLRPSELLGSLLGGMRRRGGRR